MVGWVPRNLILQMRPFFERHVLLVNIVKNILTVLDLPKISETIFLPQLLLSCNKDHVSSFLLIYIQVIPCQINPVSPNWLIFGKSVALHVRMKLAKPFEPIQNGFQDISY